MKGLASASRYMVMYTPRNARIFHSISVSPQSRLTGGLKRFPATNRGRAAQFLAAWLEHFTAGIAAGERRAIDSGSIRIPQPFGRVLLCAFVHKRQADDQAATERVDLSSDLVTIVPSECIFYGWVAHEFCCSPYS